MLSQDKKNELQDSFRKAELVPQSFGEVKEKWNKKLMTPSGKFAAFAILFIVSSAVCLAISYEYAAYQVDVPVNAGNAKELIFVVEPGEALGNIAVNLRGAGLIRNKFWFSAYIFCKGWAARMQAGEYFLSPALNLAEIARKIAEGRVIPQEIRVRVPEGSTLKEIDVLLGEKGLIEPGELEGRRELEGYLFPDTYLFDTNDGAEGVIWKMQDNFNQKVRSQLMDDITGQGKTLHEVLTMASIIEKEMPTYEERRLVAGIFENRLRDNYPLQSCATIEYILGVSKWRYTIEDTKIDSPYNTYQNVGLPPGPIGNPGFWAIKAATWPQATDYYFFLSTRDGVTIYSRTAEEHEANKAKYLGG